MQHLRPSGLPHLCSSLLLSHCPSPAPEFSFIRTKIRLLSKGQSDELRERSIPSWTSAPWAINTQSKHWGKFFVCTDRHQEAHFLLLPVPTPSTTQGQQSKKSKHLPATGSMICPRKAFALPLVTRGTQAFLEIDRCFQSSTISKANTRVHTLQSKP